jgi:hypothetical protein
VTHPDLSSDDGLLAALSESIDDLDPVPAAAVEAATTSWEIGHVEGELAALAADGSFGSLTLRRDEADLKSLTFVASRLTVELEIDDQRRAVGAISPPTATVVAVEVASQQAPFASSTVTSDELGRFAVDLAMGLCRLRIGSGPDAVFTSWFYC